MHFRITLSNLFHVSMSSAFRIIEPRPCLLQSRRKIQVFVYQFFQFLMCIGDRLLNFQGIFQKLINPFAHNFVNFVLRDNSTVGKCGRYGWLCVLIHRMIYRKPGIEIHEFVISIGAGDR